MNTQRLKTYRERLRQRIDQLRHDALNVDEEARTPTGGQTGGGLSNVPMHLADLGTDLFHQEMNSTLLENEQYLLNESLAALRRIDAGTYGICEACGVEIAEERLEALPDARTCVQCSDRLGSGLRSNLNQGRVADETETIARDEKLTQRSDLESDAGSVATSPRAAQPDSHAAGTAGGGTAAGGLAGTNAGRGDPTGDSLERMTGSGQIDAKEDQDEVGQAVSGRSGSSVGPASASKRAAAGKNLSERRKTGRPRSRKARD